MTLMEWGFNGYVLSLRRAELKGPNGSVHVEPVPLSLLGYLIEHADRVVSKDELIDAIWGGRFVGESTVSTAIKQARKAVGDSGTAQVVIKTVHGRGFRFVADLDAVPTVAARVGAGADNAGTTKPEALNFGAGQPGIAVLKFEHYGGQQDTAHMAEALPAELIAGLSRMKWLHVIARGSSFQFDPAHMDPRHVASRLGVRYLTTGVIEVLDQTLAVTLEILSADTGSLVWTDRFTATKSDVQTLRSDIVAAVISALELSIPEYEALQARRLSPQQFDAWSHFHLGLSHIFKFRRDDNLHAAEHFRAALDLDPHFARAHAGLSFTHWQNGFMYFRGDRRENQQLALQAARRALEIDPNDPFVNFNMGRAQWLEGEIASAQSWLDRALQINPNYAQCHYSKGLVLAMDGQTDLAHGSSAKALSLSPLDPLAYGIYGVRAMSAMQQEDFAAAARFGEQAMQLPGAHVYIAFIAALAHELNGNTTAALRWRDKALASRPDLTASMFLSVFPFQNEQFRKVVCKSFDRLAIAE